MTIQKMAAIARRIPKDHPRSAEIKESLRRLLAGYNGERAISYYLDFLPEKDYSIFHHLRLKNEKYFFQMDYLILSPHFALILECKNLYGTLFLDNSYEQLIRTANEKEEGFQNPLSQARSHQQQLHDFLYKNGIPLLPIDYLVTISNPSTILKTNSHNKQILEKIAHSYNLLERIKKIEQNYQGEKIDSKVIRRLSRLLLKSHTNETVDVLHKYQLSQTDIMTGIQCRGCSTFGMARKQGWWVCSQCNHKNKDGHIETLNDYFLLIDSSITNQKFRKFIHLSSQNTAKRLLTELNLPFSGSNKGRIYYRQE